MNDTMSLLLVSILLGAGGLGLYMYKLSNDDEDYNEDKLFSSEGFISGEDEKNEGNNTFEEDLETFDTKIKSRGGKTKRRKTTGGSKRKH
jgi:hypothetical protein